MLRAALLYVLIFGWTTASTGQSVPPDQSDEKRAELEALLHEQVRILLDALEEQEIDPTTDGLMTVLIKYSAIQAIQGQHQDSVLKAVFQPDAFALNYAGFLYETSPRLSGNVLFVGENRNLATIADALAIAAPGDVILVDSGTYALGEIGMRGSVIIPDLVIVGRGREATTIQQDSRTTGTAVVGAHRLMFEAATLDCNNRPFIYPRMRRSVATLRFRDCKIFNYNSGAGSSNAISGSDTVLLFDRCEFAGLEGRYYRPERGNNQGGGNAFDLRGDNWLYVRQTQFIENDEVQRVTHPAVYDGCITMNTNQRGGGGINPYPSGHTFIRENRAYIDNPDEAIPFNHATDDLVVVEYAAGLRTDAPEEAVQLAAQVNLKRNLRYWIGLLWHDDMQIRDIAAARITALTGLDVNLGRVTFEGLPEDLQQRYAAYAEAGRLANWYEQNQERLVWDEHEEQYLLNLDAADDAADTGKS